jgi:hypothetical protein
MNSIRPTYVECFGQFVNFPLLLQFATTKLASSRIVTKHRSLLCLDAC